MSHVARHAAWVLLASIACQGSGLPEANAPEAPPHGPIQPTPSAPASPETPPPVAAPAPSPSAEPATGPSEAPVSETLFVRDQRVACQGEVAMQCLQVRNSESESWRNFYAAIEGFMYEDGHAYELRVEVSRVPQPPMDSSSLRYRLLDVISKKRTSAPDTP